MLHFGEAQAHPPGEVGAGHELPAQPAPQQGFFEAREQPSQRLHRGLIAGERTIDLGGEGAGPSTSLGVSAAPFVPSGVEGHPARGQQAQPRGDVPPVLQQLQRRALLGHFTAGVQQALHRLGEQLHPPLCAAGAQGQRLEPHRVRTPATGRAHHVVAHACFAERPPRLARFRVQQLHRPALQQRRHAVRWESRLRQLEHRERQPAQRALRQRNTQPRARGHAELAERLHQQLGVVGEIAVGHRDGLGRHPGAHLSSHPAGDLPHLVAGRRRAEGAQLRRLARRRIVGEGRLPHPGQRTVGHVGLQLDLQALPPGFGFPHRVDDEGVGGRLPARRPAPHEAHARLAARGRQRLQQRQPRGRDVVHVAQLEQLEAGKGRGEPVARHLLGGQPPVVGAIDQPVLLEEGVDRAPQGGQRLHPRAQARRHVAARRFQLPRGDCLAAQLVHQLLRLRGELGGVGGHPEGRDGVLRGEAAEGEAHQERVSRREPRGRRAVHRYENGTTQFVQRIATHPADYKGQPGNADIHISADGKFLYASNRGKENNIAIFSVDASTGKLTALGYESTRGEGPRNFTIDPSGNFLLVANQLTSNVELFHRDAKTGLLKHTGNSLQIPNPVCLKFLKK